MTQEINILMAQMNPRMGAIEANTQKIIQIIEEYQHKQDVIVFPELAICGYPPEDLLLRREFLARIEHAMQTIRMASQHCHVIVGHPQIFADHCFNAASIFYHAKTVMQYFKQQLPNYGVFDERRYFTPGPMQPCVFTLKQHRIGLCICEDLWYGNAVDLLKQAAVDIVISINASPFDMTKPSQREQILHQHAQRGLQIIYVNMVGGQDELVFDGQSFALDHQGTMVARAPAFTEACHSIAIHNHTISSVITPIHHPTQMLYDALVLGLRDYVHKNNIPGVVLGLSGGIDSALTLAIEVDALGPQQVRAYLLPSRYSATMSSEDALSQANALQVSAQTISIESGFQAILDSLAPLFSVEGTTPENIQARIRAILLMAVSNQSGWMVISTSNKSETAIGYTTLYGDMCGGFAVLKDVFKTQVYELAHYRNTLSPVIPERVLTRAPSAELAPNQTDQDSLPPYDLLDAILANYMEEGLSQEELVAQGYPETAVTQILRLLHANEYKRQQAPPGTKISTRAFGRDWRYPITSD